MPKFAISLDPQRESVRWKNLNLGYNRNFVELCDPDGVRSPSMPPEASSSSGSTDRDAYLGFRKNAFLRVQKTL